MRLVLALVLFVVTGMPADAREPFTEPSIQVMIKTDQNLSEKGFHLAEQQRSFGWQRVEVPLRGTVEATLENLAHRLDTTVALERSYSLLGPQDEPSFSDQWSLENTGQSGGLPDADVDASIAWSLSTGADVVVGVIDSGIDPTNPELDDQLWTNVGETPGDGIDNDGNGFVDDVDGWDFYEGGDNDPSPDGASSDDAHATFLAGVLAAEVNGVGITGIAPEVTLMNIRACDNGFCGSFDILEAIVYAVDNGADIINLSFGGIVPRSAGDPAVEDGMDYALNNDVLVVTAAGNTPPDELDDDEIFLPAELAHSNNLAVTASDRRDEMAEFSYYSENIEVAAPGVGIFTTGLGSYVTVDGTSFAAPLVAGLAALLLSENPSMRHEELIERIGGFADRPFDIAGKVQYGRVNAGRTLTHQFIDAVGNLFENDIEWAADEGITKGCNPPTNTLFCPDDPVSREVMAAFLSRALDLPAATSDYFTDDEGSIFQDDINRLAEAGITTGCGGTRFCPGAVVDRGQMAAFLVRALSLTDDGGGDLFIDDDTSIFQGDIDRLGSAGITKGCNPPTNDKYCPDFPVDRGAMTAFLHRALDS